MTDQRKSPAEGQGFSNSFGRDYEQIFNDDIARKLVRSKRGWVGPIIVRPSPPDQNGGSLRVLSDTMRGQCPSFSSGDIIHPFALLHAARLAEQQHDYLMVAILGDGNRTDPSIQAWDDKKVTAWLRGEAGA